MTIYPPRPPEFACILCGTTVPDRWEHASRYPIPPVCNRCSFTWGKGIGGVGDLHRDRRIARVIIALAEALSVEAYQQLRGDRYGRA